MVGPAGRNREATKQTLVESVGAIIARDGFGSIGVNSIAREAGVDKVLIYRYFGGLQELLTAYSEQAEIWWQVDDIIGEHLPGPEEETLAGWLALVFRRHVDFLRHHPVTLGILAAELAKPNELAAALEAIREERSIELMRRILGRLETEAKETLRYVGPVMALLGAASNYLVARGQDVRTFNGIDIQSELGWSQIYETVELMLEGLLAPHIPGVPEGKGGFTALWSR